ncbi:transcription termination/antitermination NusG family protein [Spirosoma telluris]|uniref:transcription termination/antitermination NusG family protein n=1 Tax=Spirosoma telluris TaxID=2183553 RepID=UPI002FC35035
MPWFVLYTKSRNEKIVAEKLKAKNIKLYCPLIKTKRKWSDRTKTVEEPLFRSYCFVNLPEHQQANVFDALGVIRYLSGLNKHDIVKDSGIEIIKRMLNEAEHNLVETFTRGDQLTISSASFTNTV